VNLLSYIGEDDIIEHRIVRHRKRPGRVHRQKVVVGKRKAYHAKIFGTQDSFTVIAYEGDFAEVRVVNAYF
jgi:hypothetical protein